MSRCPDCGKFCVLRRRETELGDSYPIEMSGIRYYYHCPRCKKDFEATVCEHCGGAMPQGVELLDPRPAGPEPGTRIMTPGGFLSWEPFWWLTACVICLLSGLLLGRWIG